MLNEIDVYCMRKGVLHRDDCSEPPLTYLHLAQKKFTDSGACSYMHVHLQYMAVLYMSLLTKLLVR